MSTNTCTYIENLYGTMYVHKRAHIVLCSELLEHFVRHCVEGEGEDGGMDGGGVGEEGRVALKKFIAPLAQSLDAK